MKFHLVYSGPLSAAGNKGKAAEAALLGACWLEDNPNHQNMKGEARE